MIQVQFYECEYCHDKFEVQDDCRRCEASHQDTSDVKRDNCEYVYNEPYPQAINITFDDGQIFKYVRQPKNNVPQQPPINQVGQSIPQGVIQQPIGQQPIGQQPIGQQPIGQQPIGQQPIRQDAYVGNIPVQKSFMPMN